MMTEKMIERRTAEEEESLKHTIVMGDWMGVLPLSPLGERWRAIQELQKWVKSL